MNEEERALSTALQAYTQKLAGVARRARNGPFQVELSVGHSDSLGQVKVNVELAQLGVQFDVFNDKMNMSARSPLGDGGAFVDITNAVTAWSDRRQRGPTEDLPAEAARH